MVVAAIAINPSESQLGKVNAILNGRGRQYFVHDYPGPLSIKSVVRGEATWETDAGSFPVSAGTYILLNHRQPYSMIIESTEVVETFCIFFQAGFVEDVWRSLTSSAERLLDQPFAPTSSIGFFERLQPKQPPLAASLCALRSKTQAVMHASADVDALGDDFARLACQLLSIHYDHGKQMARVPAARASTREELFRRLTNARSLIESSLQQPLHLPQIAASACLSPFHLHRLFSQTFRETPHQYLVRRRLERAIELLTETDLPVTQVCLDCGFQSLGSFSSLFRKTFGASPQQYRRSRKKATVCLAGTGPDFRPTQLQPIG
jgi:AraC-like DNA-binding protein